MKLHTTQLVRDRSWTTRLAMAVFFMMIASAHADMLDDYRKYVIQFSSINQISFEADYTRSATIVPAENIYINAVASGDYRYRYSAGQFRVDSDIKPSSKDANALAQIASYAYDKNLYQVESLVTGAQQQYRQEPQAGVDLPMNPLVMNVAYLIHDAREATLLGLEHFSDTSGPMFLLRKASVQSDDDGTTYIRIRVPKSGNSSSIEYHIYLREFPEISGGQRLPYKQVMYMDGVAQAEIDTMGYTSISHDELILPTKISFILLENDEATIEYAAEIKSYSTSDIDKSVFVLKPNASLAQIDEYGAYQSPEGDSSVMPESPHEPPRHTGNPASSRPAFFKRPFVILLGLCALVAFGAFSFLIFHKARHS